MASPTPQPTADTANPITRPRRWRAFAMAWKRTAVFGISFGIGFALLGLLAGLGIYEYQNRTTPVHVWRSIEITNIGIKGTLKTQARDGSVRYQLTILPISGQFEDAFDRAARTTDLGTAFTALFYDRNGFERCRGEMNEITPVVDEHNVISQLDGNGSMLGCSIDDYVDSTTWNLSYKFPSLKVADASSRPPLASRSDHKIGESPVPKQIEDATGQDVLTGASYDGRLETEAGHSFRVLREAEIQTTWSWLASQQIQYECKTGVCLVKNLTNGQAVHARMSR